MSIVNVTLEEILCARDRRVDAQRRLLQTHNAPLVSFTLNIAGPVKVTPLTALAFDAGLEALYNALGRPAAAEIIRPATGYEALLVYHRPAAELKEICLALETATPAGRLYDLDVLDVNGEKLSRREARTCLVCGGPVTVCSRSRAHGLEAITGRTHELLAAHAAEVLAAMAADAMEQEVRLTPKPGLVDMQNNGAHADMDLPLFLRSIRGVTPCFRQMVLLGLSGADVPTLQMEGQRAEAAMLRATGGVNTHKGAVFSFSVLLAAAGRALATGGDLFDHAVAIVEQLVPPENTHGAAVAARYRVGGARAEALSGFANARKAARILTNSDPLTALAWLMAHTEDSNLYHRGGAEGAHFVRERAAAVLQAPLWQRVELMQKLDDELISRWLSPGGCADILALALFLRRMQMFPALATFFGREEAEDVKR